MPRTASDAIPKLRLHKSSGNAAVVIDGRYLYLGKYGTPEAKEDYDRTIADWLANRRTAPGAEGGSNTRRRVSNSGPPRRRWSNSRPPRQSMKCWPRICRMQRPGSRGPRLGRRSISDLSGYPPWRSALAPNREPVGLVGRRAAWPRRPRCSSPRSGAGTVRPATSS